VAREIDFVVVKNGTPLFGVECKTGETGLSKHISYFAHRSSVPVFYQVHTGEKDYEVAEARARVLPITTFATILGV
jgi:hypothetical protein